MAISTLLWQKNLSNALLLINHVILQTDSFDSLAIKRKMYLKKSTLKASCMQK